MRRGHSGLFLGLLVCLLACHTLHAARPTKQAPIKAGQAPSAGVRQSLKIAQAQNLLKRAKNAGMAGNAAEAERLWMQASSLDPSLQRPAWLDRKPEIATLSEIIPPVEALLKKAASLEYRDAATLLEDWLRRFPGDARVRSYYLDRAKAAQDVIQTRRHQSILQPEPPKSATPWWKYFLLILFGGLLAREAIVFIREWRNRSS